jgi:hypothetical protein
MKEFKEKRLSLSSSLLKIKIEKQIEDMENKDLNMPYI